MDNWSCGIDEFASTLNSMLDEVVNGIDDGLEPAVRKACQKANRVTKKKAKGNFSDASMKYQLKKGRYYTGFEYKVKRGKFHVTGEVGNKKYPGLVHLLEKGHATIGGGRVPGRKHLETGFEEGRKVLEEEVEKAVEAAL